MSEIQVERVDGLQPEELADADFSFDVTEEARPPFNGPGLSPVIPVAPFRKEYEVNYDLLRTSAASDFMIAAARKHDRVVAYISASRSWNNCALVEELAVDRAHRRTGVAHRLMDAVVGWAQQVGLPTVRLETQSTNIAACRFYERYGFELGGYDRYLYSALDAKRPEETALFWYLRIKK